MKRATRQTLITMLLSAALIAGGTLTACAQLKKNATEKAQTHLKTAASEQASEPIPQEPIGIKSGDLFLSYPRGENNNKIDSAATFLTGAIPATGRTLTCNGEAISANADGFFAKYVKLNYGKNNFSLVLSGQESNPLNVCVERPAPPPILSSTGFNVLPESLQPGEALGVTAGDNVQFAARGTPGCQMSVQFGGHSIMMKPALNPRGASSVNLGLNTAFGVSYQHTPAAMKDLYLGFYKVQATDNWQNAVPVFHLRKGKKELKAQAKGSITVVRQPQMMTTLHANTIVRLGPGAARSTPLPQSIRMLADGFKGEWWRLELCPNHHVWVAKEDMVADADSPALPESKVTTINLGTDSYGARIAIPLNQRLPFQIEADPGGKKLSLHIYGVTADTDFVTSDLKPTDSACAKLIEYVSWKQKGDLQYEVLTHLNFKQQWGYYADYEDNTLVLHIKSAPNIDLASGSLKGLVICVDPGHGGKELGSIGCSGVKEARVNFAFGDALRRQLEGLGARVIMTRSGDTFVSLQDRVDIAIAAKADLLISVHNNSLPDGRDPILDHGVSSYWYHPQSRELALVVQKDLAQATGFKDFGSRYQNLALCRPSQMPACLVEVGFMINPDEFSKLLNPQFQELSARSMAASIKKFLYAKIHEELAPPESPSIGTGTDHSN